MKSLDKKHIFGFVTVGSKGQIVIPVEARKMFNIKSGDKLMLIGDEIEGLAIPSNKKVTDFFASIINGDENKNG